jgi:hypothetical protein
MAACGGQHLVGWNWQDLSVPVDLDDGDGPEPQGPYR